MFKPCLLFFLCLAIRTLEHHWLSLPIEARDTNKLALLLCNQKLWKLAAALFFAIRCVRVSRSYKLFLILFEFVSLRPLSNAHLPGSLDTIFSFLVNIHVIFLINFIFLRLLLLFRSRSIAWLFLMWCPLFQEWIFFSLFSNFRWWDTIHLIKAWDFTLLIWIGMLEHQRYQHLEETYLLFLILPWYYYSNIIL